MAKTKTTNALELLREDHDRVRKLFEKAQNASDGELGDIGRQVTQSLTEHTELEEKVFYPYLRSATNRADLVEECLVEHNAAKDLLSDLEDAEPLHCRAVLKVLSEYVGHHIREEEEKMFPLVESLGVDLDALGQELVEQRKNPKRQPQWEGSPSPAGGKAEGGGGKKGGEASGREEARDTTKEDKKFLAEHGDELSRSAQRAKWIHSVDEHEDHSGQTLATRNHAVIRQWAEARKARPATSPNNEDPQRPRVLRFDFPDYDKGLQEVEWEAWLRVFDERNLVFLYQEHMKAGNDSNFFRLDSPEREDA